MLERAEEHAEWTVLAPEMVVVGSHDSSWKAKRFNPGPMGCKNSDLRGGVR